jgi:uncharacterized DUF497 family protein
MVSLKISEFDWDDGNRTKCQKHGVKIEEIEYMLIADSTKIIDDIVHSDIEKRYIAVGQTDKKRWLFVAYTFRVSKGLVLIRPISARYMHKKEVIAYEKETT